MAVSLPQFTALVAALELVLPLNAPADTLLRQYFHEHDSLGARDRAFVAEGVYATLRRYRYLESLAPPAAPRRLALAMLSRVQGRGLRELEPLCLGQDFEWLKALRSHALTDEPLGFRTDLPDWVVDRLRAVMTDDDILALGRSLQQPAALDLRVNEVLANRADVLAQFAAEGIEAEATPWSPAGLRLPGKPSIARHPLFLSGKVEVQDEGSQLLGYLLAPRRREMVVDFCAGAGGKTLLLGALMHNQGRVYAFDVSARRLSNLKPRLKRSALSNVHPVHIESETDQRVKRLAGKIDRVLVDAPCSGLGTLRRNPDLKLRQSEITVAELMVKQDAILAAAATLVKPGGRLVYATCSLLPEENEARVAHFDAGQEDFIPLDCAALLAPLGIPDLAGPFLRLSPHRHGTDGFFAAAWQRRPH